jgi:peptidoglycan/xylan/chitin deacetylase (PgdA/CDA1 family)
MSPGDEQAMSPEVSPVAAPRAPELTVVITTRDRSELLRQCLESLDQQTAPSAVFEVVVVDDGSTDGTQQMLASLTTRFRLTVVKQAPTGASAGRNAGAAYASGWLLLFVDDDEIADPGLVAAHLDAHRRHGARGVVIGAISRRVPDGADRYARLGVESASWHIEQLGRRPATFRDCFGGNCSLERSSFEAVGGFAPDLVRENDTELAYRLYVAGHAFVFTGDARVSEYRTRGWRGILADAELRGSIAVELYRRHPAMLSFLPLGGRGELSIPRARRAVESLALALRLPRAPLGAVGILLPSDRLAKAWLAFVLSHAYWSGVRTAADRELWQRSRSATLILGYHAVDAEGGKAGRLFQPPRRFARQLWWLKQRGYNVITLGEYAAYRAQHRLPPRKTLVLTIDDHDPETAAVAGPILGRLGLRATLFLVSALQTDGAPTDDPLPRGHTLRDAASLLGGPFEIGSRSRTDRRLTAIPEAEATEEISGSKRELERALGVPVTAFAYPYGDADASIRRLVEEAGYQAARGIRPGRNRPATPSFDLRSLDVHGTYSLPRFAASLILGGLGR